MLSSTIDPGALLDHGTMAPRSGTASDAASRNGHAGGNRMVGRLVSHAPDPT
ncbi:hypothetical protein BPNPMPFG_004764 [Mesorhizobium sp. AR07]|uniref:hypothetical protein n=1 Tax=Mesorhizobium sp. AR07 TaxID=2865838 RepID=UPI00215EBB59|nr:hypothetical protein [Mesorhizobium sp. AR07]UVK43018.1 hypothetical protein BPNPMPFG_004764 [Mesorhizobium sp. AR07]